MLPVATKIELTACFIHCHNKACFDTVIFYLISVIATNTARFNTFWNSTPHGASWPTRTNIYYEWLLTHGTTSVSCGYKFVENDKRGHAEDYLIEHVSPLIDNLHANGILPSFNKTASAMSSVTTPAMAITQD